MTAVDAANAWRAETPGNEGWEHTARAGTRAPSKYLMISSDTHANEPVDHLRARIDPEYRNRLPHIETDENGERWIVTEGLRPQRLRTVEAESTMGPEDKARSSSGATPEDRLADLARDGVDAEIIFPNNGLIIWATPDPVFSMAMCRAWNRWAWETFGEHNGRLCPVATLAPGDKDGTLAEIEWAAERGFHAFALPSKPVWGPPDGDAPNYNLPEFDWLWAAICDVDIAATFHVSTGRDPRAARGDGGAVINYVTHSLAPTMEPVANLCASGVCERFPDLRFATIEAGIGWVPWLLDAMDEAYKKHHFWVRPKLKQLPSEYYRMHGFSSFQEDRAGLDLCESHNLTENFMWANDYPHHEGTWPHSAEAIERTMGQISDSTSAKILGLNCARFLGIDVPAKYRQ